MSDNNGWPGQPGVPMNPERDGAHRLRHSESGLERDSLWLCGGTWVDSDGDFSSSHAAAFYTYLGPCLTPAEVEARLAEALKWRDAIEGLRTLRWNDPVRDHETPLRAVQRLLNFELTAMALDPEIHKAVKAEIAQARREALEEAAQEMDCACPQRGAVLAKLAKDGPLSHHWHCEKSDDCCALRGAAIRALSDTPPGMVLGPRDREDETRAAKILAERNQLIGILQLAVEQSQETGENEPAWLGPACRILNAGFTKAAEKGEANE
jgi:hypothetical protein